MSEGCLVLFDDGSVALMENIKVERTTYGTTATYIWQANRYVTVKEYVIEDQTGRVSAFPGNAPATVTSGDTLSFRVVTTVL